MANFIDSGDKADFLQAFDGLLEDLAQTVTVHFSPKEEPCPNCSWSMATRRSDNIYTTTNPNVLNGPLNKPFANGSICPVCHSVGKLRTQRNTTIIATISKRIEEYEQIARELGRLPKNLIKVRTKLDTWQTIKDGQRITIDGTSYARIMPEIVQGLGERMFIKTFWEQEGT